jgi:hypothetical protein
MGDALSEPAAASPDEIEIGIGRPRVSLPSRELDRLLEALASAGSPLRSPSLLRPSAICEPHSTTWHDR